MPDINVNWRKIHSELYDMGGWANDPAAPRVSSSDHGAKPIANRSECWTSPFKVPQWMKDIPEPAPKDDEPPMVYNGF